MLIDSDRLQQSILALEEFREQHGLTSEHLYECDEPFGQEVRDRQEEIRSLMPSGWSLEYQPPHYAIIVSPGYLV